MSRPGITGRFTVEIGDELGRNLLWPMTQQVLRGRWSKSALIGRGGLPELLKFPDMPGIHIEVDATQKRARIYDPLANPANVNLLREIEPLYEKISGGKGRPEEEQVFDLDPTALKSWLFWLKRTVDDGKARCVQCTLPKMQEIEALPGKTLIEPFNGSQTALKYKEDIDRARELSHNRRLGLVEEEVA